jgi:hypothetical protein
MLQTLRSSLFGGQSLIPRLSEWPLNPLRITSSPPNRMSGLTEFSCGKSFPSAKSYTGIEMKYPPDLLE